MHADARRPDGFEDIVDPANVGPAARRRVSGPGLRTFMNIADEWGLNQAQRRRMLGDPPRSTYYKWMAKAQNEDDISLSLDVLLRISATLGIYKSLGILLPRAKERTIWLNGPHQGVLFGGQSPLALMTSGTQDGLLLVRRYLDGWRGGLHGGPSQDGGVKSVSLGDLVFV